MHFRTSIFRMGAAFGALLCLTSGLHSQQGHTVGLLSIVPELSYEGYNLYYPFNQPDVFLLDACGEIVHFWPGEPQTLPGNAARLLPNGTLVKGVRRGSSVGDPIWAGGGGETIEIRSWDNDLLWSYTMNNASYRLHHDFEVMPNGNILMIAWEAKTTQEAVAAGRDPSELVEDALWPDMLLEVDPTNDSVVWEWHAWDHLIQDFDPSKENFGVISEHPELIDLNRIQVEGVADWLHINSISYHPDLDLILLSSPHFGEAWIIDHSTTSEEAAGHDGGRWGRGGDLLYRWGNPVVYGRSGNEDQKLFYPHDIRWVAIWNGNGFTYTGSISAFNNRFAVDYSVANVFTPVIDTVFREFGMLNDVFLPVDFDVTITHPDTHKLWSPALSSFQVLPNGNYLILAGRNGYAFELTEQGDVVWEYLNPLVNGNPAMQGDNVTNNLVFRFERYPIDFAAFEGRDLSPMGYIELNPDTAFCSLPTSVGPLSPARSLLVVYPNPVDADGYMTIYLDHVEPLDCMLYDIHGRIVKVFSLLPGANQVFPEGLATGVYYVSSSLAHTTVLIH